MGEPGGRRDRGGIRQALRRGSPRALLGWGLIALAAAVVVLATFLALRGEEEAERVYRFATEEHTNAAAGYTFRHPPGWELIEQGSSTTLLAPDRSVSMTFGRGAGGTLDQAQARLVAQIQATYEDVSLGAVQVAAEEGPPTIVVAGQATNARGVRIRFLAATIQGPENNWAITAFIGAGADPEEVLPTMQEVIDSFRPPETED